MRQAPIDRPDVQCATYALGLLGLLTTLAGCSTLPDGSRWGANAGYAVGWSRARAAAVDAARSPWVWAPLAGAAVMQIDNWDHRVSHWAVEHTPIYGSVDSARSWSDGLQYAAGVGYLASVLATPSGPAGPEWWQAKLGGFGVGLGAFAAAGITTGTLKAAVGRTRPNGGSDSFPSGHTTFVSAADTLATRNLDSVSMSDAAHTAFAITGDVITFATGWARVEAGAHYPSDVLVGMTIGNFFGQMFDDAFLGDDLSQRLALSVQPERRGGSVVFALRF